MISLADSWNINLKMISDMETEYEKRNNFDLDKIRKSVVKDYEKRLLSPRRKLEWTIEDFKKTEASLVSFDD